jgi:hypothetical protein
MTIPKKLKIGGHVITVKLKKMTDCGAFYNAKNLIEIREDLPQSQKEATLIHEIFHAINSVFGDSESSHVILDSFSEQLYQILVDNKMLK